METIALSNDIAARNSVPLPPSDEGVRAEGELTFDAWIEQVVARPDTDVASIARAMHADGVDEAEAHVLAAIGVLRHDKVPLDVALESARARDAIWVLLQHFRKAHRALHAEAERTDGPRPQRPISPRSLDSNIMLDDGRLIEVRATCSSPDVALFDNVLSAEECDALIELGRRRMEASGVMGEHGQTIDVDFRSSTSCGLPTDGRGLLGSLQRRIAELTQWPADHCETWELTRYRPGQSFKPHWDYFDPNSDKAHHRTEIDRFGQRIGTVVLYLSDVVKGGGTVFDIAGLEVRPRKGSALYFAYQLPDGSEDASSLHAGTPVVEGEKWIATVWLRERSHVRAS